MRKSAFALVCAAAFAPSHARADLPAKPAAPSTAAPSQPAAPAAAPANSTDPYHRESGFAAMQEEIARAMIREGVPGASVALVDGKGVVWMGGFGQGDPEHGQKIDPSTQFAAAAISPLIVGLVAVREAAMAAAPEHGAPGASLLDAPIDDDALNLTNPFKHEHALTLATLLEQTAGLEDLTPAELLFSQEGTPLFLTSALHLRAHPARWTPGLRFSPSRAGITAAAAQLERWGRHPFFALADAELFAPLGMTASTFNPNQATLDAMSMGREHGRPVAWRAPLFWPSLGLITSAQDLAALLRMLIARGQAVSGPAAGQQMIPANGIERLERGRTLGTDLIDTPGLGARNGTSDGHSWVGQHGVFAGGSAALAFFPREKVGYAILLNAQSPQALDQIAAIASGVLLAGAAAESPQPESKLPADLARASGTWRLVSVRLEALRFLDELVGFALVHAGENSIDYSPSLAPARPFVAAGNGAFRAPGDPRPTVALIARPDAEELVTPDGSYLRSSGFVVFGRLGLTVAALLALVSSLLFALVWGPRALFGSLKNAPDLRLRALPALAALVLLDICFLLFFSNQPLGTRNLTTLLLCGLTLIFPALSLAGLLDSLLGAALPGSYKSRSHLARAHAFACSLFACWLSLEMVLHGLAGIRTWAL